MKATKGWPTVDLGAHGSVDAHAVARIMADICAAEMVPRFRNLDRGEIFEKAPGDLVTVVDHACELRLAQELGTLLPGAGFVGEEAVAADASTLERIGDAGPVWVVDPLDGTANFSAGRQEFGMIVALLLDGRTVAGWIHLPLENRTLHASLGQGAFTAEGTRLQTRPHRPFDQQSGIFNIPKAGQFAAQAAILTELRESLAHSGPSRCSAYCYTRIASAELDFVIYRALKPWDHAAGVLLVGEAGGASALLETGAPYRASNNTGPLVVAGTQANVNDLRSRLLG